MAYKASRLASSNSLHLVTLLARIFHISFWINGDKFVMLQAFNDVTAVLVCSKHVQLQFLHSF